MELTASLQCTIGNFNFSAGFSLSGRRVGVFGPSGSGKSTLMNMLAGLTNPDQGRIELDGVTLYDRRKKINLPPEKRRLGVVFQHSHLFSHMDVQDNLLYGWKRTAKQYRHIGPEEIIRVLQLDHLLDRGVDLLSGGERQRVALARTVLCCPRLILMDEPLSGLDENLKFEIIPYLNRVLRKYEIPVMFISHSLLEMRLMTEEVLVFRDGRLASHTTSEQLARDCWSDSRQGYTNLLHLGVPRPHHDLWAYQWHGGKLILCEPALAEETIFELDARDILLFKKHPEATSARNMLDCVVTGLVTVENRVRVELQCDTEQLIAQVVPESISELQIEVGREIVAVIKASAFKRIC